MKVLMFAAALRKDSSNKKLIRLAAKIAKEQQCEVDMADFSEFDMPLYNADIQNSDGLPSGAIDFIKRMKAADAVIISSPEYNFSTPGTLKNLIDWVSRDVPMPWQKKHILLMSASPSLVGGNRGLWYTRVPLECCGAFVYPNMFSLADAYNAFDENEQLKNEEAAKRFKTTMTDFLKYVKV